MRQSNKQSMGKNTVGQFFTTLGVGCAFIFTLGALKKAGVEVTFNPKTSSVTQNLALGKIPSDEATAMAVLEPLPRVMKPEHKKAPKRNVSATRLRVEQWINKHAETAKSFALDKGIPAGISLAIGVDQIKKGNRIEDWEAFAALITQPLLEQKQKASKMNRSAYYKFAANSEKWASGLEVTGYYSKNQLMETINDYKLGIYDEEVKDVIINSDKSKHKIEKRATVVAEAIVDKYETDFAPAETIEEKAVAWENRYNQLVGKEVAKKVAKKELKSGKYLTEEDLQLLIEETNLQTDKALENKLMMVGRKINTTHPQASKLLDVTDPNNAHARGELYQQKVKKAGH